METEKTYAFLQLKPDAEPSSVRAALEANERPRRIQVSEPLPGRLLDAIAEAIVAHPEVGLRFYGSAGERLKDTDATLGWLERFSSVCDLSLDLWDVTSFDVLSSFTRLRHLWLGHTRSTRPSLSVVRLLPNLETLGVEAHDRDFDAIGETESLTQLWLRTPRVKTLDTLRGHQQLELLNIDFGGIRDLTPLSDIPRLQALGLYQIRRLDTDDFAPIGECRSLVGLSLGGLRNITHLAALTKSPRRTLRFLTIEHMLGLETLSHLGECEALEQLYLDESKPKDGRLDLVARAPNLRHLIAIDHYPEQQRIAVDQAFKGKTLAVRDKELRGQRHDPEIITRLRTPVSLFLAQTARS